MERTTGEQLVKYSKQKFRIIEKTPNISGRGRSVKKFSQGLFSSTLYPGTDLDNTERLEPSFLGVALLSLVFCLP